MATNDTLVGIDPKYDGADDSAGALSAIPSSLPKTTQRTSKNTAGQQYVWDGDTYVQVSPSNPSVRGGTKGAGDPRPGQYDPTYGAPRQPLSGQPQVHGTGLPAPPPAAGPAERLSNRQRIVSFWTQQGVNPQAAEGIADALYPESHYDPNAWNPDDSGSPSGGAYQHHAERLERLEKFAAAHSKPANDLDIQNQFSAWEAKGGDPIVAAHWQEIANAPDRATGKMLWQRYFERGVLQGGAGGGPEKGFGTTGSDAFQRYISEKQNAFDKSSALVDRIAAMMEKAPPGSEERHRLLDRLISHSEDLQKHYDEISKHPPKPMSPFQAMSDFAPLLIGLAALAGSKSRFPAVGAMNAAAGALQGLQEGNDKQYKLAFNLWDKQTEHALTAFNMQNQEIRLIMEDERLNAEEQQQKLTNAFRLLGLQNDLALAKAGLWKDVYDNQLNREEFALKAKRGQAEVRHWNAEADKAEAEAESYRKYGIAAKGNTPYDQAYRTEVDAWLEKNPGKNARDMDAQTRRGLEDTARKRVQRPSGVVTIMKIEAQNQAIKDAQAQLDSLGIPLDARLDTMSQAEFDEFVKDFDKDAKEVATNLYNAIHNKNPGEADMGLRDLWKTAHKQIINTAALSAAAAAGEDISNVGGPEETSTQARTTPTGNLPLDAKARSHLDRAFSSGIPYDEVRKEWADAGGDVAAFDLRYKSKSKQAQPGVFQRMFGNTPPDYGGDPSYLPGP